MWMITIYIGKRYNNRWIDMIDRYVMISRHDKYVENDDRWK